MTEIIFSHWTTYVFLFWVLVIVVANLWPTKHQGGPVNSSRTVGS